MPARQSCSKLLATAGIVALAATAAGSAAAPDGPVNAKAAALKAFADRASAYIALRAELDRRLPALKPTDDPSKLEDHRKALAAALRRARASARRGDIFGAAGDIVRAMVREDARDRTARDAYAAMQEVPKGAPPAVNAEYPERAPLATVPPLLLEKLPRLPDGLEYRFMRRDLILRDRQSNLIVDFVHEAVPTIGK